MIHFLIDFGIGVLSGIVLCGYFPEKLVKFKKFVSDFIHKDGCDHKDK
jgi:hypothetical protein